MNFGAPITMGSTGPRPVVTPVRFITLPPRIVSIPRINTYVPPPVRASTTFINSSPQMVRAPILFSSPTGPGGIQDNSGVPPPAGGNGGNRGGDGKTLDVGNIIRHLEEATRRGEQPFHLMQRIHEVIQYVEGKRTADVVMLTPLYRFIADVMDQIERPLFANREVPFDNLGQVADIYTKLTQYGIRNPVAALLKHRPLYLALDLLDLVAHELGPYHVKRVAYAIAFTSWAHGPQERRSGLPYIIHPLGVADIILRRSIDSVPVEAALMHDTIEDTRVTADQLEEIFGQRVASIVRGVSAPPKESHKWRIRKWATIEIVRWGSEEEVLVEAADKRDNIRRIRRDHEQLGESVWLSFHSTSNPKSDQEWYYRSLTEAFLARSKKGPYIDIAKAFAADVEAIFGSP